jgi:hypothetical protein
MDESVPASRQQRVHLVRDELGYGLRFLRTHAWRIVSWFVCLLIPLLGFASLLGELYEKFSGRPPSRAAVPSSRASTDARRPPS